MVVEGISLRCDVGHRPGTQTSPKVEHMFDTEIADTEIADIEGRSPRRTTPIRGGGSGS